VSLVKIYAAWLFVTNGRQRNVTNAQTWGNWYDSNYDGDCTSRDCLSGTYEISGRLIFVEQSVTICSAAVGMYCDRHLPHSKSVGYSVRYSCVTSLLYNSTHLVTLTCRQIRLYPSTFHSNITCLALAIGPCKLHYLQA